MTRNPITAILQAQSLMILDGALGTELERRGADVSAPLWSAKVVKERPDLLRQTHLDYFAAGADVATTATYQATFDAFSREGFSREEASRLLQAAVHLARQARSDFWRDEAARAGRVRPLVAASIGPFGATLGDGSEYRGRYSLARQALMDFHRQRMAALIDAGPDLLACETIPGLEEALALAQLLSEFPGVPAWIAFSCADDRHTCEGDDVAECAARLDGFEQVAALGVNCTAPQHMPALIGRMQAHTRKPVVAYPNSGEHFDLSTRRWTDCAGRLTFAEQARDWHRQGARLIGGCCRTTPADIAAIRRWACPAR